MTVNKEEVIEDLNKIKDIVILSETEGGKRLIETLTTDIIQDIERLIEGRMTFTHLDQFVSITCDIKAKLDVIRVLKRAKKNETFLKELLEDTLAA